MPTTHYRHGGSSAGRTIACPSWRTLADTLPQSEGKSSDAALEGTALHNFMEAILEGDAELTAPFTCDETGITLNGDQHARATDAYRAWVDLCERYTVDEYITEETMWMNGDVGGTADVIAFCKDTTIIIDWKFGQGVMVEPQGNPQGLFYAMLAEHAGEFDPDATNLVIAIIQPLPTRAGSETLKLWDVPKDVYELFKRTYLKAISVGSGYQTGSHCNFCPCAPICPEKTGLAGKARRLDPDLTDDLSTNLTLALELEGWIKAVKKLAHDQADLGNKIDGYKLVAKRATRKWTDPEAVEAALRKRRGVKVGEFMTTSELKSVAQLEKVIDLAVIDAYITKHSSGTTLVPEGDKRDEVITATSLKEALNRL